MACSAPRFHALIAFVAVVLSQVVLEQLAELEVSERARLPQQRRSHAERVLLVAAVDLLEEAGHVRGGPARRA